MVERFHAEFDAGNFLKIYEEADQLNFQGKNDKAFFIKQMETARNKLGTVKETKIISSSSRSHDRGTDVYLTCDTEYINGKARESFTYVFIGSEVLLEGYQISFF